MSQIPAFYRIWFTYLDPLIAIHATYMDFFTPATIFNSQIAGVTLDPDYHAFFQQLGGHLAGIAFLSTVLLRATSELKIWKILQASILIVDICLMASIYTSLSHQSRLSPSIGAGRTGVALHRGVRDAAADVLLAGLGWRSLLCCQASLSESF